MSSDLDQLLNHADPYDPTLRETFVGEASALLAEIMAQDPPALRRSHPRRRLLVAASGLVAASALAALILGPQVASEQDPPASTPIRFTAAAVAVAEQNLRLILDEPGWTVTTVYGFTKNSGTVVFENGDRYADLTWYPATEHQSYVDDRREVSQPEPVTIGGRSGALYQYSDHDFEALLDPEGTTFVGIRVAGNWREKAEILATLATMKRVDVGTWLSAMPPEVVVPGRAEQAVEEILADIPLPPNFDQSAIDRSGVNSRYYFGAQIVELVGCGWLESWKKSSDTRDIAGQERAVAALQSSKDWRFLQESARHGEYAQILWQIADQSAVGKDPVKFQESMGCARSNE